MKKFVWIVLVMLGLGLNAGCGQQAQNEELQEIIVHRKEGVNFYYSIQDRDHLVMNVEKISSDREGRNQELFNKGYPQPAKAYVLTRDQNSQ